MANSPDCEPIVDSVLGQELEKNECQILATIMQTRDLENDEILVNEGDKDTTLFVLTKGKLAVVTKKDGKEMTLYTMKVGECAGTRAFVDRAPRSATLKSVGESTVYAMTPEAFEGLLDSQPKIVYKVMRGLFRITHMNLMRMNAESQQLSNYINKTGGRY